MQIPMEILSQILIARTDSGTGIRRAPTGYDRRESEFSEVFGAARAAVPDSTLGETRNVEKSPKEDDGDLMILQEPQEETDEDKNPLTGVMGYQNNVVFILERDMESATTLDACVDTAEVIALGETEACIISPIYEELCDTINSEPDLVSKTNQSSETFQTAVGVIQTQQLSEDATNNEVGYQSASGVVTARMPEIRTSENRSNGDFESESSSYGNLSPLENENEVLKTSTQKENANHETEDSDDESKTSKAPSSNEIMNSNPIPITDNIVPERYQGALQMREAADAPVERAGLFDEMISRIEAMNTENRNAMVIELKPEFLGKVELEIAMDAAGLHVKISAANGDIRNMINSQVNALIESLENKGIEVVEVEVAYTGVYNGSNNESRHFNQAQSESRSRRAYSVRSPENNQAFAASLPMDMLDYYFDEGVSSVEYSA